MKPLPTTPSSTERNPTVQLNAALEEQVRTRAYEIYEQRGREEGHDLDDWLRAEAEVTPRQKKAKAA